MNQPTTASVFRTRPDKHTNPSENNIQMTTGEYDFDTEHRSCSLPVTTSTQIIIDRIHARADEIKRRELETAFSRLEACGELTDEQRAIIEELADALIAELLEPTTSTLRNESMTRSELQTTAELFLSSSSND